MGILIGGGAIIPVFVPGTGRRIIRRLGHRVRLRRDGARHHRGTDHLISHQIMEGRRATATREAVGHREAATQAILAVVDHLEVETLATQVAAGHRVEVTQVTPGVEDHQAVEIREVVIPEEDDRPEVEILLGAATRIQEDQTPAAIRRSNR
jgi:hypothetical protein